jgi:sigma-B regulation protein RsbU (phosphoserine phosphatase)
MRRACVLLFVAFAAYPPLTAQSFDASQSTQGVTSITAQWRFHIGDDPQWASPDFDDSA